MAGNIITTVGYGAVADAAVVVPTTSSQLFEINYAGYVQVKQAATSGEMQGRSMFEVGVR